MEAPVYDFFVRQNKNDLIRFKITGTTEHIDFNRISQKIKSRLAAIERNNLRLGMIWAFSFSLIGRFLTGF